MTSHVLMNVLDFRGPQFLALYAALALAAVALALVFRRIMRGPAGPPPPEAHKLDPCEIAAVAGGPRLAVNTAVASLFRQGALTADSTSRSLQVSDLAFRPTNPLERDVYHFINAAGKRAIHEVHRHVPGLSAVRRPTDISLLLPPERRFGIALASAAPLLALLLLGVAKVFVGIDRNRPVTFLIVFCIATAVAAIILVATTPRRTRAGDRFIEEQKTRNVALRSTATTAPTSLGATDLALAMALFGPAVLASTELDPLRRTLVANQSTSSCGSSCSSSSCGGGGGGSCGGGGGCGGCGGGGGD